MSMKRLTKNISLLMILITTISIILSSCGGGGGDGQSSESGTINGRVSDVMMTIVPMQERSYMLALLKGIFSLSRTANAQAPGLSGITVSAIVNGNTVDTDTTDAEGNFTLTASGNVTLVFTTDEFSVSIDISIPQGTVINIVVTLLPDEQSPDDQVEVEDLEIAGTIRCETGVLNISDLVNDIVIDGGGEDCVRVEGNCALSIESNNLTLTNCERCIDAGGTGQVMITSGDISCEAGEDGIRSRGNSVVTLDALGDIDILVGENGIRAEGNSTTSLSATNDINVSGDENGIRAEGTPNVNVSAGGECTIFGFIRQDGTPTLNIDDCVNVVP
jgi:hypothetical protein